MLPTPQGREFLEIFAEAGCEAVDVWTPAIEGLNELHHGVRLHGERIHLLGVGHAGSEGRFSRQRIGWRLGRWWWKLTNSVEDGLRWWNRIQSNTG